LVEKNESTTQKSITEINSNIKNLEQETNDLSDKWSFLKKQHGWISNFIKENLTDEEATALEELTYIYNSKEKSLNIQLVEKVRSFEETSETKSQLLELKKNFYKDLANYVEPDKLSNFLEYIKNDVTLNEKNKNIQEELYQEKVVLQEKVETIKEKIEEHQNVISQRIEKLIRAKISENIERLKQKPKYQWLTLEWKIFFFEKALEKTTSKKLEFENIEHKTSIIQKKVELYQIVEQSLKDEIAILIK